MGRPHRSGAGAGPRGGSAGPGVCSEPGVGRGLGAGSCFVPRRGGGVRTELSHRAGGGRGVGQRCRGVAGYTGRENGEKIQPGEINPR